MKKNIIKYIILPCFSMALAVLVFPLRVFADLGYFDLSGQCLVYKTVGSTYYWLASASNNVRVVYLDNGNNIYASLFLVSDQPFNYTMGSRSFNNACPWNPFPDPNSVDTIDSSGYYVNSFDVQVPLNGLNSVIPFHLRPAGMDMIQAAVYYTFGDGAGEAEPVITYGNVKDVSFATSIAGSGDASGNNLDRIEWNTLKDSNDNDIPSDATVSIRAVPGQYTGTNKENLLTKLYTDFVLDTANATVLDTVSASAGSYQTTWRNVANHFTWPFASVTSCLQGESYWYKNGWIYQVRLNIDEYHSEWMTIYNATSSGVENSETIINNTSITAISESVNNINNINQNTNNYYVSNSSDTTNNYYYYGSPVNPSYSGNDVSGLFPSISEILNAIRNLPSAIGQLLHDVFDDLFGIDWEYDDFEQQKQYVIANSGAFGECIGHLDDLKTLIMSYNTATGLAIIQWGDVVIDDTVIVPAGMFNLGEIIAEDPMRSFYTLYQSLFSGFLYTLTFIKIYREALKALRR